MLVRPQVIFAAAGTAQPRNNRGYWYTGIFTRRDVLVEEVADTEERTIHDREPAYRTDRNEAELWRPCEDECRCQRF